MKRLLLLSLFVLSAAQIMRGQGAAPANTKPTPPPDPQVAPLPATISLVKTFTYPPQRLPEKMTADDRKYFAYIASIPKLMSLEMIKTNDIMQVFRHLSDGKASEIWKHGEYSFLDDGSKPPNIIIAGPGMGGRAGNAELPSKIEADLAELSWVNKKFFVSEVLESGAKCYTYADPNSKQGAWIDETSRLPLRSVSPTASIVYVYKAPPTGQLVLPEAFQKRWEESKLAWRGAPR